MRLATAHAGLSLSHTRWVSSDSHLRVMIFTCQTFEDRAVGGVGDGLILIESWNFDEPA